MGTIKEEAKNYEAPKARNISEVSKIPTDLQVLEDSGEDKDGKAYRYNYFLDEDGTKVRLPNSVLDQIQQILIDMPDLKNFKVSRKGEGLNTRYSVIPFTK